MSAQDGALPILKEVAIPLIPVAYPNERFIWFHQPDLPHFDHFAWYLYFSGLRDWQVLSVIAMVAIPGILGLVVSSGKVAAVLLPRSPRLSRSLREAPVPA